MDLKSALVGLIFSDDFMDAAMRSNRERMVAYTTIACELSCLAFGIFSLNALLIAATGVLAFISFIIFKTWDIIESVIFKHTNMIQIFNGYELNNDRLSAIRKRGRVFTATSAALIRLGDRNIEKANLENIISNLNAPFKIIIHIERVDVKKILDKLRTKLYSKRIAISRLEKEPGKGHGMKIDMLKKHAEAIEHDINSITSGMVPLNLAYYIMTSGISESRFMAEEQSKHNIRNITNQFNALFCSDSEILSGDRLLRLLELDSEMVF